MFRNVNWNKLGNIGKSWQLVDFDKYPPPSWEKYWKDEREYWGADREDKKRVQTYFGKENTEENLLKKTKIGYSNYVDYLEHWNGLCKVGEEVRVISLAKNVIALSKDWTEEIIDHEDLTIWLKQKYDFLFLPKYFCCEIYSYGSVEKTSEFSNEHGRVAHLKNSHELENNMVVWDDNNHLIICDAKFKIL